MAFLEGKRALIMGVAGNRSIAFGIARAMRREGAEIALTCQNERFRQRVESLSSEVGASALIECDVGCDASIDEAFDGLEKHWGETDIVVHAVAFAPRESLQGDYLESLDREAHAVAHDISAYSFAAVAKAVRPTMQQRKGSLLTLSYLGAERAIPNYNVMGAAKASLEANVRYMAAALGPQGIRVNAISAGPIRTLAASGIAGFRSMLDSAATLAPLRRNITIDEVGNVAAFLCSDLASGITGEIVRVDAGFGIMGT